MNDHDDEQAIPPPDPSWLRPWEREGEPPASTTTFVAPRRKRRSPLSRLGDVLTTRSSAPPETEPPSARQAPPTEAETTEPDSERADLDEQPEDRGPDDAEVDQWHKWFDDLDPTPTPPTDAEPTPEPSDEPQSETPSASAEAPPRSVGVDEPAPAERPHDLPGVAESPEVDLPLADEPTDATDTTDDEPAADETDAPAEAGPETVELEIDEPPAAPAVFLDAPEFDEGLDETEPSASAKAPPAPFHLDELAPADGPHELHDVAVPPGVDGPLAEEPTDATDAADEEPAAGETTTPTRGIDDANENAPAEAVAETDEADEADESQLDLPAPPDAPTVEEGLEETEPSASAEAPAAPTELDGRQPPEAALTPSHGDATLDVVGPPEDEPSDPIEVVAEDEPTADEAPSPSPEQDEGAVAEADEADEADEAPTEPAQPPDAPAVAEHLDQAEPSAPAEAPPTPVEPDALAPVDGPHDLPDVAPPPGVDGPRLDEPTDATDAADEEPAADDNAPADPVAETDQAESDESPPEPIAPPDTPELDEHLDQTEPSASAEAGPETVGLEIDESPAAPAVSLDAPELDEDLEETEPGASAEAPAAPTELDGRQPPEAALTSSHDDTTLDVVGPTEDEPSDPIEVVAEDEPTADEAPTEPAQPPDALAVAEHLDQAEPSAPAEARPGPADVGALAPAGGPDDIPDVAESPDVGFPLADGPTDETEATDEPAADETDAPAEARPGPTDVDALTPADGPHDLPDVAVPPEGDGALLDEPTDAPEAADDERAADDNAPAEAVTETDQAESDESQPEPIAPPDTPEADEHLDETESTASAEAPPTPADVDALAPAEGPHDLPDVAESPRTDLPLADGPTDATDTADDEPAADETDVPAEADTETVEVETDASPAAPTVSLDAPEVDEHLEESETGASAEAVAETDQVEADEAPPEPGTPPDAPEVDESVDEAGPTASAEAVAETDETDEIESDEFRLDLSTPPDAATDDDSHQAAAAGDPAEAPASPTELDGLQPPEAVLTPPHDDAPLDLVGPPEDEPSDPIEVLAEDEPTADEAPSPAPEQDEDEDAVDEVDEVDEVEADEAPPEPVTVLDVPEVDEHLEETGPRAPAEAPPAPIELDGPEPPEAPIAPQADDAPLDVVWPPEDEPSHATEDLAEDQPATEEAPSLATERAEEAEETSPEPIAPPDTPGLVEPLDETESSAPAEAPPTPVETGPTEPAHGLAEAASEAPAPAHASAPAATTVAEPQLDEPDLRETESGPWLRDVDEAARDLDETDRNHRKVLAGAVLSLLVVAVVFGGVRIAQDRAADAAREQAARQTQTTTLATDVLDLADAIGPAAAGAEPLAASLLVTLEEHLLASERSDAELDEARSDAVDELQRLADELREALAGPAPVPGTLVLDDAADPVLLAHARVRAEATALAGEADDAADRAESWGAAVRSVTTALATHARIASEQPETSDPDELAAAWSAELGPLRVLADVAADAATVPGLQDWADVHAVFAADSLTWVQRAVTLLEDGDVEAYNTELEEALGVDDPFGFSAALADGTRTALDSPVLDAVATVEARAALVAQQVDALERTTGERLTAAPTP